MGIFIPTGGEFFPIFPCCGKQLIFLACGTIQYIFEASGKKWLQTGSFSPGWGGFPVFPKLVGKELGIFFEKKYFMVYDLLEGVID